MWKNFKYVPILIFKDENSTNRIHIGDSLLSIFSISYVFAQSGLYSLEIRPINAINALIVTGVDFTVYNDETGATAVKQYESLPPSSFMIYFLDGEMPPYSTFSVCASYHTTGELIDCSYHEAGMASDEYLEIDIDPLR